MTISLTFSLSCQNRGIVDMTVEIPSPVIAVEDEFYNSQPAWHPFQEKIIYISSSLSTDNDSTVAVGAIKEVDLENGETRLLLDESSLACFPNYSPDGNAIVFCARKNNSQNIHILNLATHEISAITDDNGWRTYPRWSPDGKTVAFIHDGRVAIYQLDNHRFEFPENIGKNVRSVCWGKSENQLIIARTLKENIELSLYDIKSNTLNPLTTLQQFDGSWLSFAPLKSSLQNARAFLIFQNANKIYLFDFSKTQVNKIIQSGQTPAMSPQGNRVAFSQNGRIVIETLWVDVNG